MSSARVYTTLRVIEGGDDDEHHNTPQAELDALATDGFVVLERVLSAEEIAAIKAALAPYLQGKYMGRNRFEGLRSTLHRRSLQSLYQSR